MRIRCYSLLPSHSGMKRGPFQKCGSREPAVMEMSQLILHGDVYASHIHLFAALAFVCSASSDTPTQQVPRPPLSADPWRQYTELTTEVSETMRAYRRQYCRQYRCHWRCWRLRASHVPQRCQEKETPRRYTTCLQRLIRHPNIIVLTPCHD